MNYIIIFIAIIILVLIYFSYQRENFSNTYTSDCVSPSAIYRIDNKNLSLKHACKNNYGGKYEKCKRFKYDFAKTGRRCKYQNHQDDSLDDYRYKF